MAENESTRDQEKTLVGYARVSTTDQDTSLQIDALRKAQITTIYQDKSSGVGKRPELQRALENIQKGQILVVWKIDRVARSLGDLLQILGRLKKAGASIKSLTEPIDTSTPIGEFTFQILGAVAQLERSMIRERVMAGQVAARARGKRWGPALRFTDEERGQMTDMWHWGIEQATLAEMFEVSVSTIRDNIHRHECRGIHAHRRPKCNQVQVTESLEVQHA